MKEKLGLEPAFPREWSKIKQSPDAPAQIGIAQQGMSKRFYAACTIAPSVISAIMKDKERLTSIDNVAKSESVSHEEIIINIVYEYVDELLKQEQL